LAATIECLVAEGYSGTTTRAVAARAGVSLGALQHHFPSRAVLVTDALRALADQLVAQLLEPTIVGSDDWRERSEALIDRLWEVHRGPFFEALLELWVAARSDRELRDPLDAVFQDLAVSVLEGALYAFPDLVARPGFVEVVVTGLATVRGLALLAFLPSGDPDALWPATRAHLIELLQTAANAEGREG